MTKRRLPIGIQTFGKIRDQNCYYVERTPFIKALVDGGSHYFLSRLRRFGKRLFSGLNNVYLFEFKVLEMATEGAAMAQLKAKGYADKYRALGEPIHLIAVEFSKKERNILAFDTQIA